jgi:hypothetical protein
MSLPPNFYSSTCNNSDAVIHQDSSYLPTPAQLLFAQVMFGLGVAINCICIIIFAIAKRTMKSDRLAVRREIFIWTSAMASFIHMSCTQLTVIVPIFPCSIYLILVIQVVVWLGGTLVGKLLLFYMFSMTSQAVEIASKAEQNHLVTETSSISSTSNNQHGLGNKTFHSAYLILRNLLWGIPMDNDGNWTESLKWLRFIISRRGIFTIVFSVLAPFLILAVAMLGSDPGYVECYNCHITTPVSAVIMSITIILLILGILIARRIQHFPDPFGLARECSLFVCCCILGFLGYLVQTFAPNETAIFNGQQLDHTYILTVAIWLCTIIQSLIPILLALVDSYKLSSSYTLKGNRGPVVPRTNHQQRGMTGRGKVAESSQVANLSINPENVDLDFILKHRVLLKLFETHVKAELGLESLLFIQDALSWKESYYDMGQTHRRTKFKRIYRSYIALGANFELNLPWELRQELTHVNDGKDDADIPYQVFDRSISEVKILLNIGAMKRFKASSAFRQAVDDLALIRDQGVGGGGGVNVGSGTIVVSIGKDRTSNSRGGGSEHAGSSSGV